MRTEIVIEIIAALNQHAMAWQSDQFGCVKKIENLVETVEELYHHFETDCTNKLCAKDLRRETKHLIKLYKQGLLRYKLPHA